MVQTGFYILTAIALSMLVLLFKNDAAPQKATRVYFLLCSIWGAYLLALNGLHVLDHFGLPPRVVLLIVLPAVIGIIYATGRKSFLVVLKQTPLHLPVFLQSFRILVELLIYGAFLEGVFPERATFKGLNYDILVGLSAIIVGLLVLQNKFSPEMLLGWNIVSLLILSVTVYSFISTYYFTDYLLIQVGGKSFVDFPYLLLASVLLPIAIFLHVFSIRQIRVYKHTTQVNA